MSYTARDFNSLIGMKGFSETILKNHFTLYQGYVANTNKAAEALAQMLKDGKTGTPEFAELKRRFGWEFNGMRLHELYFENLKGSGGMDRSGRLAKKMEKELPDLIRVHRRSGPIFCIRPYDSHYVRSSAQ